jgi:hypothetical protein
MNQDISASQSKKSKISASGKTPFDEILLLEEREKARVQKEIEAMQKAEQEMEQTCAKKEAEAEQKLKEAAKAELKEFREKELSTILKDAEVKAAKKCKKLEEAFAESSAKLAKKMADDLLEAPDFLIAA